MVRNAGKFGKPKRGGGKRFTSARTLRAEASGNDADGLWSERRKDGDGDDDSEEEEDSDESDDDDDDDDSDGFGGRIGGSSTGGAAAARPPPSGPSAIKVDPNNKFAVTEDQLEREEQEKRKQAKKELKAKKQAESAAKKNKLHGKDDDDDKDDDSDEDESSEESGGNGKSLQAGSGNRSLTKTMKASSISEAPKRPVAQGMNRKEREEQAKKEARERYLAATRAGKTDEAKADLARLAKIRKDREEAAARKAAEKASAEEAKQKALAASGRKK